MLLLCGADMSAVAGAQVLVAVGGVAGEDVDLVLVRVPAHAALGLDLLRPGVEPGGNCIKIGLPGKSIL